MTSPTSPTLRTSETTTGAIRVLQGDMTSATGGTPRVTHDRLIAALVVVGRKHRDELVEALRLSPEALALHLLK